MCVILMVSLIFALRNLSRYRHSNAPNIGISGVAVAAVRHLVCNQSTKQSNTSCADASVVGDSMKVAGEQSGLSGSKVRGRER